MHCVKYLLNKPSLVWRCTVSVAKNIKICFNCHQKSIDVVDRVNKGQCCVLLVTNPSRHKPLQQASLWSSIFLRFIPRYNKKKEISNKEPIYHLAKKRKPYHNILNCSSCQSFHGRVLELNQHVIRLKHL